jgi:hypothetical protein
MLGVGTFVCRHPPRLRFSCLLLGSALVLLLGWYRMLACCEPVWCVWWYCLMLVLSLLCFGGDGGDRVSDLSDLSSLIGMVWELVFELVLVLVREWCSDWTRYGRSGGPWRFLLVGELYCRWRCRVSDCPDWLSYRRKKDVYCYCSMIVVFSLRERHFL